MSINLIIHVTAGTLALASGYLALYATKGATTHRRSGMAFVVSMLMMCAFGIIMTGLRGHEWTVVNTSAGTFSAYLVITSLTAIRPVSKGGRWLDTGGFLFVLALAAIDLGFGLEAITNGGKRNGIPAFPYLMFGVVALIAAFGDLRILRSGPLRGSARLARHLWRMCFALFIAAMSFFLGQAKVIPAALRKGPLLALPVLAVLITMFYWLWRVRRRGIARNTSLNLRVPSRENSEGSASLLPHPLEQPLS
jgi:hypothetical protein